MSDNKPSVYWDEGLPRSVQFSDVYFSADSGLDESEHVFIRHNELTQRWLAKDRFVVAELGFGFGLNFLLTLRNWLSSEPTGLRYLDYLAVESSPPSGDDIRRALSRWPVLSEELVWLLEHYPPPISGVVRINCPKRRVRLTLMIGDVGWAMQQHLGRVDAWYLDGFSPAKNPAMWSADIYKQMARWSADDATFATYTAAGSVRRGLLAAGFDVQKVAGFGRKRHMLCGRIARGVVNREGFRHFVVPDISGVRSVAVIGAGVAGCALALALAQRGCAVQLYDRCASICNEGSAVPAAQLKPVIHRQQSSYDSYINAGFLYTRSWLNLLASFGFEYADIGTAMIAKSPKDIEMFAQYIARRQPVSRWANWLDSCELSERIAAKTVVPGLFLPLAAKVEPAYFAQAMLDFAGDAVEKHFGVCISRFSSTASGVELTDDVGGTYSADYLVIADAGASGILSQLGDLSLARQVGQVSAVTYSGWSPQCMLSYGGYAIPGGDRLWVGSTFRSVGVDCAPLVADDRENLANLAGVLADIGEASVVGNFVGSRCSYRDHLPLVGPVMSMPTFCSSYERVWHGDRRERYPEPLDERVSLSLGFGSKGLAGVMLAAEYIAAAIDGTPLPLGVVERRAIHPHRVWLK